VTHRRGRFGSAAVFIVSSLVACSPVIGQTLSGRETIEALSYGPLEFDQPKPDRHEVDGVQVFLIENRSLPLITLIASFKGGYGLFGRDNYAAGTGLPALLRYGGTQDLAPDSVDETLEFYAIQTSFGSGGNGISSTMNTLTEHLPLATELWTDMPTRPRFDANEIEVWRGRQLESVLRRPDDPTRLAFSEFNRLLYGDHPIGWEMAPSDLATELLTGDRFRALHGRIVCKDNLLLGVTGDADWAEIEPHVTALIRAVPSCPESLPESPIPDIRREPGVFLIERDLEQAVIVMAHPTELPLADDPEYFAATIGNSILGAGGFSSRLVGRVRTEEGYAYSASSLWTTPRRYEGLVGAITRTRPENTVPAIEVILETMTELRDTPPTEVEVRTSVDRIANGFVFNFETPTQIVSRTISYIALDLPEDWLQRYLRGVQQVTPAAVRQVFGEHLKPEQMTILIVGDSDRIGLMNLEGLGPVTVLEIRN
jgi:zinc protease